MHIEASLSYLIIFPAYIIDAMKYRREQMRVTIVKNCNAKRNDSRTVKCSWIEFVEEDTRKKAGG